MLFDNVSGLSTAVLVASVFLAGSVFTGPANAKQPLLVRAIRAEMQADKQVVSLTGEIVARDAVGLSFPMGGRILSISVREGDHVTKGQELARLESVQQEQALVGVEAALDAAQADLFQAKEEFDRQDTFLERGATTRIQRDEAQRRYRITQANVERAKAELTRARKTYGDTFLYASADGIVINRLADPGAVVPAARPILKVALGERLDAVFDAPEAIPALQASRAITAGTAAGQGVVLDLLDKPEIRFHGAVREVSPLVDPYKGTVKVTVGIDHAPRQATYGSPVRGTFIVSGPPRITIPYTALTALGDRPAVWVMDPDTRAVALSPITISRYASDYVIVETGIEPGQRIVTVGAQLLFPGRIVQPMERK